MNIIKKNCFWIVNEPDGWANWIAYINPTAKMCASCGQEEVRTDQTICYDCYKRNTGQRLIRDNEIVIDIDDPTENGLLCYMQTGINLVNAGYHIQIYYADGMKNPHIHVKDILGLGDLDSYQLKNYKEAFIKKYVPKEFWNDKVPDLALCSKHLIAEEDKPHHKYKTIKKLRSEFNRNNQNYVEKDLLNDSLNVQSVQSVRINKPEGEYLYQKIASKIQITTIAKAFGLDVWKNKAICPFHSDSNASLNLNDEKGLFNCFGCNASGNIIKFYAMLKKINPNFKVQVGGKSQ